jgi:hypothetical protein
MSIHVCKCVHNGREEFHLRYPGLSESEAQALADKINAGQLDQPAAQAVPVSTLERLRQALKFYADGDHFTKHQPDVWDTVSGEPANFWEDENATATVEDGSVAKAALEGVELQNEDGTPFNPAAQGVVELPPLPEAYYELSTVNTLSKPGAPRGERGYTADQMQAYARAALAQAPAAEPLTDDAMYAERWRLATAGGEGVGAGVCAWRWNGHPGVEAYQYRRLTRVEAETAIDAALAAAKEQP